MKKIETIIEDLSTDKISYYYKQGFEIGKEETLFYLVNKMVINNIDKDTISKITNLPLEVINDFTFQL